MEKLLNTISEPLFELEKEEPWWSQIVDTSADTIPAEMILPNLETYKKIEEDFANGIERKDLENFPYFLVSIDSIYHFHTNPYRKVVEV